MARRSAKISGKRSPQTAVTSTRQSKRLKADESVPVRTKAKSQAQNRKPTPKKSKYFEPQAASDSDKDEDREEPGNSDLESDYLNESGHEDAVIAPTSTEPEGEEGTEDFGEEFLKPKMRRRTTGRKPALKAMLPASKELLKEGVKTGLEPGKEVRTRLPKAREAGDIPYQDDRIHPNTFLFLKDLAQHNDRLWLKLLEDRRRSSEMWAMRFDSFLFLVHDKDYRNSQKDFETFVEKLTEKVIEKDDTIPELPMKDLLSPVEEMLGVLGR
ncbi:hypothetical protein FGG08_002472 [Glutinoglossum americanum]|uniref:Uncharacterized protein n=1 Tax=Glutinoglossum americanum TaxID=1670608 RepID=A0A9P8I969_9PEZI|nr:hypothetical protein FGG08_002472 [Glutinoglossum americanum]